MSTERAQIAQYFVELRAGGAEAETKLVPLIEAELRRLLFERLRQDNAADDLQAALLITDACVALLPGREGDHCDRLLFSSIAASSLRRLLLEYARQVNSEASSSCDPGLKTRLVFNLRPHQFIALDEALKRLAKLDEKHCRVVELKLFAGLREKDIGDLLVRSAQSVKSVWRLTRAWLFEQLTDSDAITITTTAEVGQGSSPSTASVAGAAAAAAHHDRKGVQWTPERWQWVSKLFEDAVSEDYAQRSLWLKNHCHGDAQLEVQLGLLLAADQRAGKFLEAGGLLTVDYSPADRLTHSLDCGQVISGDSKSGASWTVVVWARSTRHGTWN